MRNTTKTQRNGPPRRILFLHCKIPFAMHPEGMPSYSSVGLTVYSPTSFLIVSVTDVGHGGQQPAIDGLNEYIVTCYYKKILDNTLREYLVNPLPAGTRLTAILDSCHSRTWTVILATGFCIDALNVVCTSSRVGVTVTTSMGCSGRRSRSQSRASSSA
jgi:hypothetical protein